MALPSPLGRLPSFTNAPGASGFEKLQNSPFGSGSLTAGLSQRIQQAGGLGNMRGTPVGRSTMDPERALGMLSRGTARPGQVQAALSLEQLQRGRRTEARDEQAFQQDQAANQRLEEAFRRMTGEQTTQPLFTTPPTIDTTGMGMAQPTPPVIAPTVPAAPPVVSTIAGQAGMTGDLLQRPRDTLSAYLNPFSF
jgi:hypothetical protein